MSTIPDRVAGRYLEASFALEAMSNLRPKKTGVDGAIIWISAGEFAGADLVHGPRIKVVAGERVTTDGLRDAVTITLTDPPRVLGTLAAAIKRKALTFVERNREVLLQHWRGELDSAEVIEQLVRVP